MKIPVNTKFIELKKVSIYNIFKNCLLLVIFLLIAVVAQSQSLSDIQNLKVDDLSDAQIEQLIKRAEASGISTTQLSALARERGMSATEAGKLSARIRELRMSANSQSGVSDELGSRSVNGFQEEDMFDSIRRSDPYYDLTVKQKKIFGFKLFHNKDLNFSPSLNIPTPQSYVIGSGDQLLLDVYGASQQSYDLSISAWFS